VPVADTLKRELQQRQNMLDFYKDVAPERGLVCCRLAAPPHAAAAGVIFSGQNLCRAQSQNCDTKKTHACPARKTGGDSGDVEIG
jgi:hypothetical protein